MTALYHGLKAFSDSEHEILYTIYAYQFKVKVCDHARFVVLAERAQELALIGASTKGMVVNAEESLAVAYLAPSINFKTGMVGIWVRSDQQERCIEF